MNSLFFFTQDLTPTSNHPIIDDSIHQKTFDRPYSHDQRMNILSLPPEILRLITLHNLFPSPSFSSPHRLHPCNNCRHLRKGFQRRDRGCPALFLTNHLLHRIASETFYHNVIIVVGLDYHSQPFYFRCYPTPACDKDTVTVLSGRKSVLPFVRNLEVLIARTLPYDPVTLDRRGHDVVFRSNWEDPAQGLRYLTQNLPGLKSLRATAGLGTVANDSTSIWPHMARVERLDPRLDDEILAHETGMSLASLKYHHRLGDVLGHPVPCAGGGLLHISHVRLWITGSSLAQLLKVIRTSPRPISPPQPDPDADTDVLASSTSDDPDEPDEEDEMNTNLAKLSTHPFLSATLDLPHLSHLDIFLYVSPPHVTSVATHLASLPFGEEYDELIIKLRELLKKGFAHVDEVKIWRALSENVTSEEFEGFEGEGEREGGEGHEKGGEVGGGFYGELWEMGRREGERMRI